MRMRRADVYRFQTGDLPALDDRGADVVDVVPAKPDAVYRAERRAPAAGIVVKVYGACEHIVKHALGGIV